MCNIYIEEVNKIALSANNNKRIQSTDSEETYGTCKDILHEIEESKCNSIIKNTIKWLIILMLQEKAKQNIIKSGFRIKIIQLEY